MAIATGTAAVLAALAAGGASVAASHSAASSNKQATQVQSDSNAEALKFAKEQEATRIKTEARQEAEAKAQYEARERLLAPYRQASAGILGQRSADLGIDLGTIGGFGPARAAGIPASGLPSSEGQNSGRTVDPYTSATLASLAGYEQTPEPMAPAAPAKLTLADLMNLRKAGDWRTGRVA